MTQLVSETLTRTPQDLTYRSYFGRHMRPSTAGWLDLDRSAADLARQVRALDFGEYRNPRSVPKIIFSNTWLAVGRAHVEEMASTSSSGTILEVSESALRIATSDGVLILENLRKLDGADIDLVALVRPGDRLEKPGRCRFLCGFWGLQSWSSRRT